MVVLLMTAVHTGGVRRETAVWVRSSSSSGGVGVMHACVPCVLRKSIARLSLVGYIYTFWGHLGAGIPEYIYHTPPSGRFSMLDITTVGLVSVPKRSASQTAGRELSEDFAFITCSPLVVEQPSLENGPRRGMIHTRRIRAHT